MLKNKLLNLHYRLNNVKVRAAFFSKRRALNCGVLKKNAEFKNIHKGERCFILGNGPSLRDEDLSQLSDEIVFTVNQAVRNSQFKQLKTNYHFWADPIFFNIDVNKPEDMELLDSMMSVGEDNPELQCFFPLQQMNFIKQFEIDKKLNVNYFYSGLNLYEGFDEDIDYTKVVIGFNTVVQWCITMAIYMGFEEIYLLGCDNTSIVTTVKSVLHQNDDNDYAYTVTENEKKRMERMLEKNSLELYLISFLHTIKSFRQLYQYCTKRNIKLVNCSSVTVIDSIPRMRLTDVLKKSK